MAQVPIAAVDDLANADAIIFGTLRVERFYKHRMINGMMASAAGQINTFPLRGIKDSPPYLHDGRLPLEDTWSSST